MAVQSYDDRKECEFVAVQNAQRRKLMLFIAAMFLALGVIVISVWSRGVNSSSPRDWLFMALMVIVTFAGILGLAILPRSRHYQIVNRTLDYPRWGGIRRGRLSLTTVDAFRREGRDPRASSIVLLTAKRRTFLLPEDLLASPPAFVETLRSLGLTEL